MADQKDEVGKTTTVVSLAIALVEARMRVLAVGSGPQGNLSNGLRIEKKEKEDTVYKLLMEGCIFEETVYKIYLENLGVPASNVSLSGLKLGLLDKRNREYVLKHYLEPVVEQHDYVFIDCPSSSGLLTVNAMTAATSVTIPIQCGYHAMEGLDQMPHSIELLQAKLNPALRISGIIFTMYDAQSNLSQQVMDSMRNVLKEYIYDTVIAQNVRVAEAPNYGMPMTEYDPRSKGAEDYWKLVAGTLTREVD